MLTYTVLDRIEIEGATVFFRLGKQVRNGDKLISSEWHRSVIAFDVDPDEQIAVVNVHLAAMGYPAIAVSDADRIKAFVALARE
jgi:hypothetical protein